MRKTKVTKVEFLFLQWSCLLVCVGSIWVKRDNVASYMLMGGVAASRLGLWMFDLAVIQQMQVGKTFISV